MSSQDQAISQADELVDKGIGHGIRRRRQKRRLGSHVDRRAGENKPAHLLWKTRSINQRKPAALTKTDQIQGRTNIVDRDVERRELRIDRVKSRLRRRRLPLGEEETRAAIRA